MNRFKKNLFSMKKHWVGISIIATVLIFSWFSAQALRSNEVREIKNVATAVVGAMDDEISFVDRRLSNTKAERDRAKKDLEACRVQLEQYKEMAEQCIDEKIRVKR